MKKTSIKLFALALTGVFALNSCSDQFLEDKKNYDQANTDAYNYFSGALARLDDVYWFTLPDANAKPSWKYASSGSDDDHSKCTEEYSGFGPFVDPQKPLTYQSGNNPVPDYFQGQANNVRESAWGRIRNCNDVIAGITGSTLTEEEKNQLLGQAYFLRAWCYYNLVKWYGGVPIITEVQNPSSDAVVPRSTTAACVQFICDDLERANTLLAPFTTNGGWASSSNYGRVTSGTALALKGRLLLLYASPLFNRANDPQRWKDAYDFMIKALPVIESCGYGLASADNPGINASGWASIFASTGKNPEAVFVTLYNTIETGGRPDFAKNNNWENGIRPSNAMGGGGKTPSAMIVDMFPMKDGKRPASAATYTKLNASDIAYNPEQPFMNRDPRFYRTFAFPGVRWTFNGDPTNDKNNNPYKGSNYELWNYVWYLDAADRDNPESGNSYGSDNLLSNTKGFYIRKRSDDGSSGSTYIFEADGNGFKRSAAPYMEMRFAEVLLNYAEAACGAGYMDVAVDQLQKIRARVGYTAADNYGLQADLASNQEACMAAILYERQIELAYEGKRFDDLRRWMLFDGGTGKVDGAPDTWTLTGWGRNTCTYLGFKPLNGQRRENLEFRISNSINNGLGTEKDWGIGQPNPDPLYGIAYGENPSGNAQRKAIDLSKDLDAQQTALSEFYNEYLVRKEKKGDAYDSGKNKLYMDFKPYYYFLGLSQGAQNNNPTLPQNIGWGDHNRGGAPGTFDPLAN